MLSIRAHHTYVNRNISLRENGRSNITTQIEKILQLYIWMYGQNSTVNYSLVFIFEYEWRILYFDRPNL